ncbi:amidohydrolase family protein [Pseudonocardia acaciae]|uniref:amidohydrolase family protein n=1 Tax=Pseudonocardia acaciae TaxID=551276 RepID=UPI00048BC867|nr:amidohydrolase family protein [Pseudonocardia acaciae]
MTNTSRPDPPSRIVDVHAHAVPPDLLAALRSRRRGSSPGSLPELGGDDRIRFGSRSTPPVSPALTDAAARLAAMDDTGVDVQVVSPWLELSPDELEPDAATAFLRLLNDGMAALAATEPERLRALVLLDRRDPAAATAELVRTAAVPGVVGVELPAAGSGPPLHDPAWNPLWSEASARGSFVLLHPWQRPAAPGGAREGPRLGDIVDNPAQSTAAVGAMVLAGVFDRHPDLRVCVVHGGGFLPYQAGRFDAIARLAPDRPDGARTPSDVLRTLYYDSLTHSSRSLSWLVEFAGADRVLLGSDYPFPTGDAAAVRAVTAAGGLTPADRTAVLGANAYRLLGC